MLCGYLILNNQWFWFFKIFNIKEPPVQVFWENKNQRTASSTYFSNIKELMVLIKEVPAARKVVFWILRKVLYQNRFFIYFSPPLLGRWIYTRVDNPGVSIADSDSRTTLVLIAFSLLDADHWLAISAKVVFFNFVNKWTYDHPQKEWAKFG